jgi:hypothetical protein
MALSDFISFPEEDMRYDDVLATFYPSQGSYRRLLLGLGLIFVPFSGIPLSFYFSLLFFKKD